MSVCRICIIWRARTGTRSDCRTLRKIASFWRLIGYIYFLSISCLFLSDSHSAYSFCDKFDDKIHRMKRQFFIVFKYFQYSVFYLPLFSFNFSVSLSPLSRSLLPLFPSPRSTRLERGSIRGGSAAVRRQCDVSSRDVGERGDSDAGSVRDCSEGHGT